MANEKPTTRSVSPSRADPKTRALGALYDKSWGLVIGINDYGGRHDRLANARNDAEAMEKLLCDDYAFDRVISLYDAEASRDAILEWLKDGLPGLAGPNDRVVIFFAGHGTTREGAQGYSRGYIIPQDAEAAKYSDYVDMTDLHDACGWIKAKHVLIILDCCFSGIAAVTARADPAPPPEVLSDAYLRRISQRPARQILTAGASDDLAADSGSRPGHSAFTGALLSGLEGQADQNGDGIITASELANYVKPEVTRETATAWREGQSPFFNYLAGSGQGDFVFLRPGQPVRIPQQPPPVWQQTDSVLRLPYWLWGVLVAMLLLLGGLAWTVWGPKPAGKAIETPQGSPATTLVASITAEQVAAIAGQTMTAASLRTTEAVVAKTADARASSTAAAASSATALAARVETRVAISRTVEVATRRAEATQRAAQTPSPIAPLPTPLRPPNFRYTGHGVRVAILGPGVDVSHPDLRGRVAILEDFTDTWVSEDGGYGTYIAGLVAGTGAKSDGRYQGLAPEASLYIAKAFSASSVESPASVDDIARWAGEVHGVHIVLWPLGGEGDCGSTDSHAQASTRLVQQGVVVVAASGSPDIESPGCTQGAITVGALGKDGHVASFSGRGPTADGGTKPDLVAPGEDVLGLRARDATLGRPLDEYYTIASGTGPAAAYVAGVVALMLEAQPALGPEDVKQLLQMTAIDLGEAPNVQGAGAVDLRAAVEAASAWQPAATPTATRTPTPTATAEPTLSPASIFYRITVATGNRFLGGTDAAVYITLLGSTGVSGELELDNPGNEFEIGDRDVFSIKARDVGSVRQVRIRHDNSGFGAGWFLDGITVRKENTGEEWSFPCGRWLAKDEDDGRIERTLDRAP